jgi:hypothetical protein
MRSNSASDVPDWTQLLLNALDTPGVLSKAYQQFWRYSIGNQILAMFECMRRGLQPGPINTFKGWYDLGRHVRRGEKALTLCMPVTVKRKPRGHSSDTVTDKTSIQERSELPGDPKANAPEEHITVFTYKPRWFVLSQTEGNEYIPTELPAWSESRSLERLTIKRVEFTHSDGNCQGFARLREVAVSPIAFLPHKTLFHEIAHVVLGHTLERTFEDQSNTPVSIREVEAECVALICCESLGLAGASECRGYIQHWLSGQVLPDRCAQRIFKTADAVLKAGYPSDPGATND